MKIKDQTYRKFCCTCLILAVIGMMVGMIVQMALDWREAGPLPLILPLIVFSTPSLIHPLLCRIGIVDGYFNYTQEELSALKEFYKDIGKG